MFKGPLPQKFAERTPRVIQTGDGSEAWLLDGLVLPEIAINAVVGRDVEQRGSSNPPRFAEVRRGTEGHRSKHVRDWTSTACTHRSTFPPPCSASPVSA